MEILFDSSILFPKCLIRSGSCYFINQGIGCLYFILMLMNLSLFMHCRDAEDKNIPGLHWLGRWQVASAPQDWQTETHSPLQAVKRRLSELEHVWVWDGAAPTEGSRKKKVQTQRSRTHLLWGDGDNRGSTVPPWSKLVVYKHNFSVTGLQF